VISATHLASLLVRIDRNCFKEGDNWCSRCCCYNFSYCCYSNKFLKTYLSKLVNEVLLTTLKHTKKRSVPG
jgi:hypothetical protein